MPNPGTTVNTQILTEVSQCVEGINGVKEGRWKATLSFYKPMVREQANAMEFPCDFLGISLQEQPNRKMMVPLPAPVGLLCLGNFYPFFTSFCFVSMANGVNLTDGLDGFSGRTAALAFTGMSIAVLPICSDLAVFRASMAGACAGFLFHNRYKASIFMGDTGALALGGALAAMAACTGMFFPLFISSGIFVLEALSVIMQAFKTSRIMYSMYFS